MNDFLDISMRQKISSPYNFFLILAVLSLQNFYRKHYKIKQNFKYHSMKIFYSKAFLPKRLIFVNGFVNHD